MKVFLSVDDVTAEIKVPGPYSPDVLSDICHRACELITQQRIAEKVIDAADE